MQRAPGPVASRRGVSSLACTKCRKHKQKCDKSDDGPCSRCLRTKNVCIFDEASDGRRKAHAQLNRKLAQRLEELEDLVGQIRRGGAEAARAIQEIQLGSECTVKKSRTQMLALDLAGQVHYYGQTSNITGGLVATDSFLTGPSGGALEFAAPEYPEALIENLLDLYFCWQDTYYKIFEKDLFLRDRASNGKHYCSFLFNAVLAHASMICDLPILRSDPSDPSTAGHIFFKRAQEEIPQVLTHRSLTTVQGLLLLASREAGNNRNSIGWIYSGMAFRMALDLGLHLNCQDLLEAGYLTSEDARARNTTFWGCYIFDQGWSLYLGRTPAFRIANVTLEKLEYEDEESVMWHPPGSNIEVPFYRHNSFVAILKLYEILEEVVANVYGSWNSNTSRSLSLHSIPSSLDYWLNNLPTNLRHSAHPTMIMLMALFNSLKVFLLREISPNSVELQQATETITALMVKYDNLYTLQKSTNLSVYVIFTAATACFELMGSDPQREKVQLCSRLLSKIGCSWLSANIIRDQLEYMIIFGNYCKDS